MRTCLGMAVGLLLCALLASAACAASQTQHGDVELALSASGQWLDVEDVDLTVYQLSMDAGRFVTDQVEIGVKLDYARLQIGVEDLDESADLWQLLGTVAYHLPSETNTVPFASLKLGLWDIEELVDTEFLWGLGIGIKQYSSPDRFWKVELIYQNYDVEDVDVNGFTLGLGMGFRFPAERREETRDTAGRTFEERREASPAAEQRTNVPPPPPSDWQPKTEW